MSTLKDLLHRIAAQPAVYDVIQFLAGAHVVRRRLAAVTRPIRPTAKTILDVGGGTGALTHLWRPDARYICLDIDPLKLAGFRKKHPAGLAILGDATQTPIASASLDAVICTSVSHHLDDTLLPSLFREAARMLKPDGRFLFLDATWQPRRWPGRLLWAYDRGSFPRTEETLRHLINRDLSVLHWQRFAVFHEYMLAVARPRLH